jgi:hypothetical protein
MALTTGLTIVVGALGALFSYLVYRQNLPRVEARLRDISSRYDVNAENALRVRMELELLAYNRPFSVDDITFRDIGPSGQTVDSGPLTAADQSRLAGKGRPPATIPQGDIYRVTFTRDYEHPPNVFKVRVNCEGSTVAHAELDVGRLWRRDVPQDVRE